MNQIEKNAENIDYSAIPITALSNETINSLSNYLSRPKILLSEEGYQRDYRGVAQLIGIPMEYRSSIVSSNAPMLAVLEYWKQMDSDNATIGSLHSILGNIDRWDVIDDIQTKFFADAINYLNKTKRLKSASSVQLNQASDFDMITIHDTPFDLSIYDALILYDDADVEFAEVVIERLENAGFKICVKDRDILAGIPFEHDAIMRLIETRCNTVVPIISQEFLCSPLNKFLLTYAQALQIQQAAKKIIPFVYKNCKLPSTLTFYYCIYFEKSGSRFDVWEKLEKSIRLIPKPYLMNSSRSIRDSPKSTQGPNEQLKDVKIKAEAKLQAIMPEIKEVSATTTVPIVNSEDTLECTKPPKTKNKLNRFTESFTGLKNTLRSKSRKKDKKSKQKELAS